MHPHARPPHPARPRPRVDWIATPPPGTTRRAPAPVRRARYNGPPSYATPPRWGFPALSWRWQTSVPGSPQAAPSVVDRLRLTARPAVLLLWLTAVVSTFTGLAEVWRYVLLVRSRDGALTAGTVRLSDTMVVGGALLAMIAAVVTAVVVLWWFYVARAAAAEQTGLRPARPDWQVLLWLVVPGLNLVVVGALLAELEHAVLGRSGTRRPRPSRLVLAWWLAWAVGGVLTAVTLLWRLRDGVQAMADGVVLHALTDLAAACVAVLTALVVRSFTALLAPIDGATVRQLRVVRVTGAPPPQLRATRPASARR